MHFVRWHDLERVETKDLAGMEDSVRSAVSAIGGGVVVNENFRNTSDAPGVIWGANAFAMTNPSGKLLRVSRGLSGKAALPLKVGANLFDGILIDDTTSTEKTIDLTSKPLVAHQVGVRAIQVDTDFAPRVFWNKDAVGVKEYLKTVATRRTIDWEVKAEVTLSPADGWVVIGTVTPGASNLTIVDARHKDLLFEPYDTTALSKSTWGDGINDRNTDRLTHGVKSLHEFAAAVTRQIQGLITNIAPGSVGGKGWFAAITEGLEQKVSLTTAQTISADHDFTGVVQMTNLSVETNPFLANAGAIVNGTLTVNDDLSLPGILSVDATAGTATWSADLVTMVDSFWPHLEQAVFDHTQVHPLTASTFRDGGLVLRSSGTTTGTSPTSPGSITAPLHWRAGTSTTTPDGISAYGWRAAAGDPALTFRALVSGVLSTEVMTLRKDRVTLGPSVFLDLEYAPVRVGKHFAAVEGNAARDVRERNVNACMALISKPASTIFTDGSHHVKSTGISSITAGFAGAVYHLVVTMANARADTNYGVKWTGYRGMTNPPTAADLVQAVIYDKTTTAFKIAFYYNNSGTWTNVQTTTTDAASKLEGIIEVCGDAA